jgi:hypothetical protein
MAAKGNYYISMMSEETHPEDFEDLSTPCNEQQSHKVTPSSSCSARPNHKRSKNIVSEKEDWFLHAWLNISLDPITRTYQTHKSYWTRIHYYFNENLGLATNRAEKSFMHRWSTIQDSVNKFIGRLSSKNEGIVDGTKKCNQALLPPHHLFLIKLRSRMPKALVMAL